MQINFFVEVTGMRKTINVAAFIVFFWLVLDALNVPSSLLNFLLIGALPGTAVSLPPTTMLAIMTGLMGIVVFEFSARRFEIVRRIRQLLFSVTTRRERLPTRRFTRI